MAAKDWITGYKLNYPDSLFSIQVLLVAFGSLITVPIITGLDPGVALFTAGAATLIFHGFTKRCIPVFLASSFAYMAPILIATETWDLAAALGGLVAADLVYTGIGGIIAGYLVSIPFGIIGSSSLAVHPGLPFQTLYSRNLTFMPLFFWFRQWSHRQLHILATSSPLARSQKGITCANPVSIGRCWVTVRQIRSQP
jgi:xanthine/uracil permease